MMGSALAHYEGIKAFSETDQTNDLKAIAVPTLVMQGDDDQIVPYKTHQCCRPSCSCMARSRFTLAFRTA
jgi:pimeloyl-ACP methyl ester carboxylesterase